MTLPYERTCAVIRTRYFLAFLLDPKEIQRVPKYVRDSAYRLLKHYPTDADIDRAAEAAPDVFEKVKR